MRHLPSLWLVVVCVISAGLTATGSAQTTAAEKAVVQAIDQINQAFQKRDIKTYEGLTTTDFLRVTSVGRAYGRAEWLKTVAAPGAERGAGKFDELSVRVYGDGAVVTYRNMPAGGAVSYLTRIMERQGAQWKMALAQSTDVQAPPAPAGPAPAPLPAWSATSAAEKEALAAFNAIQKANRERDLAAWEKLSGPDHTIIAADGTRTTRAERVAALKAPAAATAAAPPPPDRNVRIMVKGDLAAVTWEAAQSRSLKVLARQGGQWRQVLQQSSPIVAAK